MRTVAGATNKPIKLTKMSDLHRSLSENEPCKVMCFTIPKELGETFFVLYGPVSQVSVQYPTLIEVYTTLPEFTSTSLSMVSVHENWHALASRFWKIFFERRRRE